MMYTPEQCTPGSVMLKLVAVCGMAVVTGAIDESLVRTVTSNDLSMPHIHDREFSGSWTGNNIQ